MIKQAAVLCGGLGTRLGELTRSTPKPLLIVAGTPFLEILIGELVRHGVSRIVLLASFESEQVRAFADELVARVHRPLFIDVAVEPSQAGTGGALWHAGDKLDESFFLLNGNSWFDCPLLSLANLLETSGNALGALALRPMPASPRYGEVELNGDRVIGFRPGGREVGTMLVNGGVYAFRRRLLDTLKPVCSLEQDIFPQTAEQGQLRGLVSEGAFIDIGIPKDFARAQDEIGRRLRKPALFLDRDGVLNVDHGHVGSADRFEWIPGARHAVRMANLAGYYVFVVTNQAGIAKGLYSEADHFQLMSHVREELAAVGAHIDDSRYCPFHPEGTIERYRGVSGWRKPSPGMLEDILRTWPVDVERSLLIGDKQSDIQAAEQVGIAGHLFTGGDLDEFLRPLIEPSTMTGVRA